tara:strand:- start:63 stop:536 length:474 start_codon:yes stop_codon:yes gene_type:complete
MSNYSPEQPHVYQGKQIIITSDRVLFNAQNDSVLIHADKSIGFNTSGTINFDTDNDKVDNRFVVNSPNIYLGLNGKSPPTEPAVLGDALEFWLNDLLRYLVELNKFLLASYTVTCPTGLSSPGENNMSHLTRRIDLLRDAIINTKSDNVKIASRSGE